jgi:hypothetical protein
MSDREDDNTPYNTADGRHIANNTEKLAVSRPVALEGPIARSRPAYGR